MQAGMLTFLRYWQLATLVQVHVVMATLVPLLTDGNTGAGTAGEGNWYRYWQVAILVLAGRVTLVPLLAVGQHW